MTIESSDRREWPDQPGCPVRAGARDLVDPLLYQGDDAHDSWRELRRHAPVDWRPVAGGLGFWSVTKFRDAERVLRDHDSFTSERGTLLTLLGVDDPAGGRQMAVTDPPGHARLRDPLQRVLTIKSVERRRERIRSFVVSSLAPLADGGAADLAESLALLPMAVTGELMGLPERDWPYLARLTTAAVAPDDPEFQLAGGPAATQALAHRELFAYFHEVLRERIASPGDDLISVLAAIESADGLLLSGEIVSNCYSLLLGANVTTPHVVTATLAELMGTGVLDDWAAHPEWTVEATEEALRWASPANHFMRHATRDVGLGEARIAAGDAVVVWLGSANRDEDVFDDPFTFDPRRRPNRHLAFGAGPHYCIGHTIARVTLRTFFAELLSRYHGFAPEGPAARLASNFVAGYKHFPISARTR